MGMIFHLLVGMKMEENSVWWILVIHLFLVLTLGSPLEDIEDLFLDQRCPHFEVTSGAVGKVLFISISGSQRITLLSQPSVPQRKYTKCLLKKKNCKKNISFLVEMLLMIWKLKR